MFKIKLKLFFWCFIEEWLICMLHQLTSHACEYWVGGISISCKNSSQVTVTLRGYLVYCTWVYIDDMTLSCIRPQTWQEVWAKLGMNESAALHRPRCDVTEVFCQTFKQEGSDCVKVLRDSFVFGSLSGTTHPAIPSPNNAPFFTVLHLVFTQ